MAHRQQRLSLLKRDSSAGYILVLVSVAIALLITVSAIVLQLAAVYYLRTAVLEASKISAKAPLEQAIRSLNGSAPDEAAISLALKTGVSQQFSDIMSNSGTLVKGAWGWGSGITVGLAGEDLSGAATDYTGIITTGHHSFSCGSPPCFTPVTIAEHIAGLGAGDINALKFDITRSTAPTFLFPSLLPEGAVLNFRQTTSSLAALPKNVFVLLGLWGMAQENYSENPSLLQIPVGSCPTAQGDPIPNLIVSKMFNLLQLQRPTYPFNDSMLYKSDWTKCATVSKSAYPAAANPMNSVRVIYNTVEPPQPIMRVHSMLYEIYRTIDRTAVPGDRVGFLAFDQEGISTSYSALSQPTEANFILMMNALTPATWGTNVLPITRGLLPRNHTSVGALQRPQGLNLPVALSAAITQLKTYKEALPVSQSEIVLVTRSGPMCVTGLVPECGLDVANTVPALTALQAIVQELRKYDIKLTILHIKDGYLQVRKGTSGCMSYQELRERQTIVDGGTDPILYFANLDPKLIRYFPVSGECQGSALESVDTDYLTKLTAACNAKAGAVGMPILDTDLGASASLSHTGDDLYCDALFSSYGAGYWGPLNAALEEIVSRSVAPARVE